MRNPAKLFLLLFLVCGNLIFSQSKFEYIKRQAVNHMTYGRYGEAIDLLNKFITANARNPEGYNLRGLCFEKRETYQFAVLDFRRAVNLEPENPEYNRNLERAIRIWHQRLYEKIDGHKREIAIDPTVAVNYLEIGKSYRWLEIWPKAEIWYDKYLARDDNASPDEIIRYTEILAKTGSIKKGERVLEKYVEKHPDDWRLWSRYGYFTMWLGNYDKAKKAFKNALGFKPFFKEAQDGLDLAERKGYLTKYTPRAFEKVYPIDRYYRKLKNNPDDDESRFKLVNELVKENRIEEAYQQLQILSNEYADSSNYLDVLTRVETLRDSLYENRVDYYEEVLKQNPRDRETVLKLADTYGRLYFYDEALRVLQNYIDNYADDTAQDIRYQIARYSAWNYEWERAIEQLEYLLEIFPDNLHYQLLRAQIAVWTVLELDYAEELLSSVLEKDPENLNAILSLVSLYSWKKDFELAQSYLNKAKELAPGNQEVEAAASNYAIHLSAQEEMKILKIRADAGLLAQEGDCLGALDMYDEYFNKITGPTKEELIEYADIAVCAEDFETALYTYDRILEDEYDSRVALRRAKVFLWMKDSVSAVNELERLHEEEPGTYDTKLFLGHAYQLAGRTEDANNLYEDVLNMLDDPDVEELISQSKFNARLSIGDSFMKQEKYSRADDLYSEMLEVEEDSVNIDILQKRIDWIPPYGINGFIHNFYDIITPNYAAITPSAMYYTDNQGLRFSNLGIRGMLGLNFFLSAGASYTRTNIIGIERLGSDRRNFHIIRGHIIVIPANNFTFSGSFGQMRTENFDNEYVWDAQLSYDNTSNLNITGFYQHNDARLVLYSPFMIEENFNLEHFRLSSKYIHDKRLHLSGSLNLYDIEDENWGLTNNFRVGKLFGDSLFVGYEFIYSGFRMTSNLYYAPDNYQSHSIWAEWYKEIDENLNILLFGKLGYVPSADFILREFSLEFKYNPFQNLNLALKFSAGDSYKYEDSYEYFSIQFTGRYNIN